MKYRTPDRPPDAIDPYEKDRLAPMVLSWLART